MNSRAVAFPLVALGVVALLVYLRPAPIEAEVSGATEPATNDALPVREFQFHRSIQFPEPPESIRRQGPVADRVERWFQRLLWAPSHQVFYTQNRLTELDEDEQVEFADKTRALFRERPVQAAPCITVLGSFSVPEAHALIREAALHSSALVRGEAARALLLMDSPDAARWAGELLDDPAESVRRNALRTLNAMETPEASTVLEKYAESDPDEGIRHVLLRLSTREDPSVIPALRVHMNRKDDGRYFALQGLARFGDGNALDVLFDLLVSPNYTEVQHAIQGLILAPPSTIDVRRIEPLVTHQRPEIRQLVAEIVGGVACSEEADANQREMAIELLLRQMADLDTRVKRNCLRGLYRAGRHDVAEPYLKLIASGNGFALNQAIEVAAHDLEDPRARTLIVERLKSATDPSEQAALITGLGYVVDDDSMPILLDYIRRANPDEPLDGSNIPLSQRAAMFVAKVGPAAQGPLFEIIAADDLHEHAKLRAIDALRGIADSDCVEELLLVAQDEDQPMSVRRAALETIPLVEKGDLFEIVSDALQDFEDPDLAQLALKILLDYA